MKTSCEMIQDLLPLYCDGVCSETSKQIIEEHLQDCEKCREDLLFMKSDMKVTSAHTIEEKIAKAAVSAWKKGKKRSFIKGCLITLLSIAICIGGYALFHYVSTVEETNLDALAKQAADYFDYDELIVEKVERRGNYLAALCTDDNEIWCMCVFQRDRLFEDRWYANGGIPSLEKGTIESWNYGSPQNEAVLIFCGGDIPNEVCWYQFQNSNIIYTCPVEDRTLLDIFVIPDRTSINGYPILLDSNQQKIE